MFSKESVRVIRGEKGREHKKIKAVTEYLKHLRVGLESESTHLTNANKIL